MTGTGRDELGAAPTGGRAGRGADAAPTTDPATLATDGTAEAPETGTDLSGSPVAPLVAGLVMIGFGVLMLTQTLAIKGDGFALDGPRFMPLVVTVAWLALSTAYLAQQLLRMARSRSNLPAERFAHTGRVAALLALLVGYAYTIDPLGYMIATSLFFVGAARVLGSRLLVRDINLAVGLSVAVYFVFTRLLGAYLPPGVLPL